MEYASAIRFGGMLVAAPDCTYEHYLNRGLLCPCCKDPVFLRAGSSRTRGDASYEVKAHFCHFPSKDAALVAECELRVKSMTPEEFKHLESQARGQRVRLLQRWFWSVIQKHPKMRDFDDRLRISRKVVELKQEVKVQEAKIEKLKNDPKKAKRVAEALAKFDQSLAVLQDYSGDRPWITSLVEWFHENLEQAKAIVDPFFESVLAAKEDENLAALTSGKITAEEIWDIAGELPSLDLRMQKVIIKEVIDFLATKRNSQMLNELLMAEAVMKYSPEDTCRGVVATIATIHWAEEFEQLESSNNKVLATK